MADEATQDAVDEAAQNQTDADQSTASDGDDTEGEKSLGDAGKKALDAMKAKWKEAERVSRERESALAELQAKIDGKEAEHAETLKQRQAEEAALAKANDRILKAEIRATAAGKLADPADALRYLDLKDFEVGDDGEVDTAAVSEALDHLVKSKPYLAAQGGAGTVFESPGSRRNGGPVAQIKSRDELGRMTPEQINTARAEGRLNDLLGIKN